MNDADIVADASAVIALLVGEPFTRFDPLRLAGASISAVNLSEVLARLQEIGMPESEVASAVARLNLRVVAFDEPQARATARLRSVTRGAGLSLGDRACLRLVEGDHSQIQFRDGRVGFALRHTDFEQPRQHFRQIHRANEGVAEALGLEPQEGFANQ